jgi:hypothetical protein
MNFITQNLYILLQNINIGYVFNKIANFGIFFAKATIRNKKAIKVHFIENH